MGLSESFGFEERWLRKVFQVVPQYPDIFRKERIDDAQYLLGGLGNRQVMALRDWARGMGVIRESKKSVFDLTPLGKILARYDPQLSEYGSLWVIHHSLCMAPEDIWFYAFYANTFGTGTFSRGDLKNHLSQARALSQTVIEKKCLAPLLHTMRTTKLGDELGILVSQNGGTYERLPPDLSRMHVAVLAFMLCDWCSRQDRTTVSLTELYAEGGTGRYTALDRTSLSEMLPRVQERYSQKVLWFSQTAGLDTLTLAEDMPPLALLIAYYLEHLEGYEPLKALDIALRDVVEVVESTK